MHDLKARYGDVAVVNLLAYKRNRLQRFLLADLKHYLIVGLYNRVYL
jgi:hypothetical protein